jgi:hypothetical protein
MRDDEGSETRGGGSRDTCVVLKVKYRRWFKGVPPRPIHIALPGWAGDRSPRTDGSVPQPWHCQPFVEASTYGLELLYPFNAECRVTNDGQRIAFEGDFTGEAPWSRESPPAPPFLAFAPGHYGFTSSLDMVAPEGFALRIESHPRVYTDTSGEVPLVVPGHLDRFWPRIFFVVFKAPPVGGTHVFRRGDAYAQAIFIPASVKYEVAEMADEETCERARIDRAIESCKALPTQRWISQAGNSFDDKYKRLQRAFNVGGWAAVSELVDRLSKSSAPAEKSTARDG